MMFSALNYQKTMLIGLLYCFGERNCPLWSAA